MKVAAFGRTRWLLDSIRAVSVAGHEVVLVGTAPPAPEYGVSEDDFRRLAGELSCAFVLGARINDEEFRSQVAACGAQIGMSVNWPTLIGAATMGLFPRGILNFHAGDLPRYRGNAAPNWAILAGDDRVVATIHFMSLDLDAGPIVLQRALPLTAETYIGQVYQFLAESVPQLFVDAISGLESGTVVPRVQPEDPAVALRGFPRIPADSRIDWTEPAEQLARLVRASAEPFAGAYTYWGDRMLRVWRARPDRLPYRWLGMPGQVAERRRESREVAVLTGDGVLVLQEVETADGGRGPAADLIRSSRIRLGLDTQSIVEAYLARLRANRA